MSYCLTIGSRLYLTGCDSRTLTNDVRLDTVNRFKGLEAEVVILWGLDGLDLCEHEELLYVGLSRAKSLLIVCATTAIIEQL